MRFSRLILVLLALFVIGQFVGLPVASSAEPPVDGSEFFEKQVRPLLVERCYSCHAKGQKKGGLSMSSRVEMLAGGDSGAVLMPGQPAESLLIQVLEQTGDIQMPPNGKLSAKEIATVREWVKLGAPWPESAASSGAIRESGSISAEDRSFWSFQPIRSPELPAIKNSDQAQTALDYFIASERQLAGLEPVGEADKRALLRRATFDLTGLPPALEEIEAFIADTRPDAWERVLDRLLAAPQYGERWGRYWLDLARYGEDQAHTFAARKYPQGYRYRDWVIQSLNADLPYDQFVAEQIAGDLLTTGEQFEQLPALGFFALGPVYYADAGCAAKAKMDELDDRIDTLSRGFLGLTVSCARCHDHKFDPISVQDYYALAGIFASTDYKEVPLASQLEVKSHEARTARVKAQEQLLTELYDVELTKLGTAQLPQLAQYLVAAWTVQNKKLSSSKLSIPKFAAEQQLSVEYLEGFVKFLPSKNLDKPVWAELKKVLDSQDARKDLSADASAVEAISKAAQSIQEKIQATVAKQDKLAADFSTAVETAAPDQKSKVKKASLEKKEADLLKEIFANDKSPLRLPRDRAEKLCSAEIKNQLAELKVELEKRKQEVGASLPTAHSLIEGTATNLKIHLRGDTKQLGDEAPRRFLSVLSSSEPPTFTQGSGRLELAQAIASPQNPLTGRVAVNRVWQNHFGRGLVGTPSNFGMLGQRPTHPELLDHLTSWFFAQNWSMKRLHREIMSSATYQLDSRRDDKNFEQDPENRLLWRANRRRLDIEAWRDALLAAAGNLDLATGGTSFNLADGKSRRRTLYAAVSRHDLNGMLRLFDFPDPNLTSEQRVTTTVPMQQLFVLNSEFMVQQAQAVAGRLQREPLVDDAARVRRLYELLLGRPPHDNELNLGLTFLKNAAAENDVKLKPWEQYAQAILGTNEFLFVD